MPNDRVTLRAPAKINLYLEVTGRREDGYHFLATLMQKVSLYDRVDIRKTSSGIRLRCPDSDLPENENNIVYRAADQFLGMLSGKMQKNSVGVDITLHKNIPVAAGLGGGSSDAAAVITGLNELLETDCTETELLDIGLALGADVPFFVSAMPVAWATGIGECLQPAVPLTGFAVLIVNPGFSVSTPWVYENFALTVEENINNLKNLQTSGSDRESLQDFLGRAIRPEELVNDLEKVTAGQYREIEILKQRLLESGAEAALMSGSGPTVFGLFDKRMAERAAACEQSLKKHYSQTYLVEPLQF